MSQTPDPIEAEDEFAAATDDMIPENLAEIAKRQADVHKLIFGARATDIGMNAITAAALNQEVPDWREMLEHISEALELPGAAELHGLSAYAYGGVFHAGAGDTEATREQIRQTIAFARELEAKIPSDWHDAIDSLKSTLCAAEGRWALEHDEGITIAQLAALAERSEKSVRNNLADTASPLRQEKGEIPADIAWPWLEARGVRPSTWHLKQPSQRITEDQPPSEPVFVPVAKDGSWFHPGCHGVDGYYRIGPDDRQVGDYDTALQELQAMATPQWRRPGPSGTPGRVAGVRWERRFRDDLPSLAET